MPSASTLSVAATPVVPVAPVHPIAVLVGSLLSLVNPFSPSNPAVALTNSLQLVVFDVLRSVETGFGFLPIAGTPGTGTGGIPMPGAPRPGDVAHTPYGDIGKWMLQPNGQISNFGGQTYGGKTLLEPVNIVILDPTSTSPEQAAAKLNAALSRAGFPAQAIHSSGFQGIIDGTTYGQQPTGFLEAFSNNFFLLPGDHARAFGPAPAKNGTGYVWTAAASREVFGFYGLEPTHTYVSYNAARDELAQRLTLSGATWVGVVSLGNAYNTATTTTGDNDGNAAVIWLN